MTDIAVIGAAISDLVCV